MTAGAVARVLVNDARSKMVSSVIGSAGGGDPSSPRSPASVRAPYAWWKTPLPPSPITTTAPGSLCAAIASFISVETAAKSGAGTATGGNAGATGGGVGCALSVTAVCSAFPGEHAVANASTAAPTARAVRTVGLPNIKLAFLLQNLGVQRQFRGTRPYTAIVSPLASVVRHIAADERNATPLVTAEVRSGPDARQTPGRRHATKPGANSTGPAAGEWNNTSWVRPSAASRPANDPQLGCASVSRPRRKCGPTPAPTPNAKT